MPACSFALRSAFPPRSARPLVWIVLTAFLSVVPMAQPGASDPVTYRPPVEGPVTDPFRPPPRPWMAGNRGVEYSPAPGTPVASAGPGTVIFAGPVAGTLHVTVAHPDGLRTSYSFLSSISVVRGRVVEGGALLGRSGPVLHWGVRDPDGNYLDPMSLLGRPRSAVLVAGGDDGALPGRTVPGRGETSPSREGRPAWVDRLFAPLRAAVLEDPPSLHRVRFGAIVEAT